jgi:uncharacterized protein
MILIDANLLVYAHVRSFPEHAAAKAWLDERLGGTSSVGLPWPSLLGFLRLVTNARVFERPETIVQAWRQVEAWLDSAVSWVPSATERHREVLAELLAVPGLRANHVPDAHLAALAIEHGLTLCSSDSDFSRFPGLRWRNPLM